MSEKDDRKTAFLAPKARAPEARSRRGRNLPRVDRVEQAFMPALTAHKKAFLAPQAAAQRSEAARKDQQSGAR
jgi:hypothetical protein